MATSLALNRKVVPVSSRTTLSLTCFTVKRSAGTGDRVGISLQCTGLAFPSFRQAQTWVREGLPTNQGRPENQWLTCARTNPDAASLCRTSMIGLG